MGCSHTIIPASEGHLFACPGSRIGSRVRWIRAYFTLNDDGGLDLHNVPVPKPTELESLSAEDRSYVDTWGARVLRRRAVNCLGPRAKRLAQWMTRYQPVPEYDHQDDPGWLLMKRILSQLIDESSVPVVIVPIPQRQHFDKVASSKAY